MLMVEKWGRTRPNRAERGAGRVDVVARVLFVAAVVGLAFGYGYVARGWKLFPHAQMQRAEDAVEAMALQYAEADYLRVPARHPEGGVRVLDKSAAAPGLTFVTLYTGERFLARLVDLEGNVAHEWHVGFREAWGGVPAHVRFAADDADIEWHGTHLFPDGSLLLNFEGQLFPYGGGLVRVDRDSRVVWKLARNTHHDVEVAPDGTIWVPALNYRPDGMPELPGFEPWFYEDTVLKVSLEDGRVLDEISIPLALRTMPGLLPPNQETFDPTHLNDVEVVTAEQARAFPMLAPGDVLVSLRNISAVVAIDPVRKVAKWALTGPFRRQHDPDLLPNGKVLLFDNLGGDPACGRSRVLELDPVTLAEAWRYDGCRGGERFESEAWGAQELLPNGNVLVTESFGGQVLEVTRQARPRIVWAYANVIGERDGRPLGGVVGQARRFAPGELPFVDGLLSSRTKQPSEPVRRADAAGTARQERENSL
jgi:hypothetical protein